MCSVKGAGKGSVRKLKPTTVTMTSCTPERFLFEQLTLGALSGDSPSDLLLKAGRREGEKV